MIFRNHIIYYMHVNLINARYTMDTVLVDINYIFEKNT